MMFNENNSCEHIAGVKTLKKAKENVCEKCIQEGTQWVHLRTCQSCGITLCCDNSPMKHATAHFHQTAHPIISSAEPHENWVWCYLDEIFLEF